MSGKRESAGVFILVAGLAFYLLAATVTVFAPWFSKSVVQDTVVDVDENQVPSPKYTDAQMHGRDVYKREGCWLCHSQAVRGMWVKTKDGHEYVSRAGDEERYGPISQAGESRYDRPHLFGTRRIGPDLARTGGKYADAWHIGHFLNPQAVVPGSVMPKFTWLYLDVEYDEKGDPVIGSGQPTVELMDLISYMQGLGTGIGDWLGAAPVGGAEVDVSKMSTDQLVKMGKELFGKVGCAQCHGPEGRGDGPTAVTFPDSNKPRNYYTSEFKWGDDVESVSETISKGRLPYMPAHPQLQADQVAALAEYVRSLRSK